MHGFHSLAAHARRPASGTIDGCGINPVRLRTAGWLFESQDAPPLSDRKMVSLGVLR
jgi:hypothetical protein